MHNHVDCSNDSCSIFHYFLQISQIPGKCSHNFHILDYQACALEHRNTDISGCFIIVIALQVKLTISLTVVKNSLFIWYFAISSGNLTPSYPRRDGIGIEVLVCIIRIVVFMFGWMVNLDRAIS